MQAEDKARVGDFSHQVQILPEQFTGDQKQLLWNLRTNLQSARNGPSPVWYAVDRSMTALSPEGGRRVVLMLSDGHDDPSYGQPRTTFKELQQRVVEEEMMIYAVGVPASLQNNWGVTFNRISPMIGMKFQPPDPDLRKIAEQSGGGYFELDWRDDLDATFERVADELHRQYLLGFVPAALDGKTHTIDVRVNNRDAKVRARKNYLATTKR
jgi:VWFA-related protein